MIFNFNFCTDIFRLLNDDSSALLTMCDEDDDGAVVFECGASLAANAFPNFEEIRRSGKLCDVVLVAGSTRLNFMSELICFLKITA